MDKFEEFLKAEAIKENEDFVLPKSFEKNLEDVLSSLDTIDNKKKFKIDKKFFVMAASLMMVSLVGIGYRGNIQTGDQTGFSETDQNVSRMVMPEMADIDIDENQVETTRGIEAIINVTNLENVTITNFDSESSYKIVDASMDITPLINLVNNTYLEAIEPELANDGEWNFEIQVSGDEIYSIKIKDDFISINDVSWYRSNESLKDKVNEVYNNLP